MKLEAKCVVLPGGQWVIGAPLARRFSSEGARGVVVADIQDEQLQEVVEEIGGLGVRCDVTKESDINALIDAAEARYGPIDLFCSNAGIVLPGGPETSDALWERTI